MTPISIPDCRHDMLGHNLKGIGPVEFVPVVDGNPE